MRSVANSRVRWAIVIESEFAITKLPTKSAIPPNASRKSCRKEMNEFVSSASFFACCCAGARLGGRRQDRAATCFKAPGRTTPGFAAIAISSSLPALVEQPLGRREVEPGEGRAADRRDRRRT